MAKCRLIDQVPIVGRVIWPPLSSLQTSTLLRCDLHSKSKPSVTRNVHCLDRRISVATTADVEAPLETTETIKEEFNWFKHWWPVQFTYNLDTDRPNRIQLLGEFFAVWKSKNGEWVAMKDMCPHRLAPLSEGTPPDPMPLLRCCVGRVEDDGTLMCSYHGWRFNEGGSCVKIPQADSEKSHQTACGNPRSAAQTYPCKERGRILWIWPDDSYSAYLDAAAASVALPDDIADYLESKDNLRWGFTRLLPYDYEILMENTQDPSHLPFSHHGTIPGLTREQGAALNMKPATSTIPMSQASFEYPGISGYPATLDRIGNCLVLYAIRLSDPSQSPGYNVIFVVPVAEGQSRVLTGTVIAGALYGHKRNKFSSLGFFQRRFPALTHWLQNRVIDGDNVFLHIQADLLKEVDGQEWTPQMYFMPTSADSMVMNFRRWLSTKGGGPFGATRSENRTLLSRRELLDRYHSHTIECRVSQEALGFFEQLAEGFKAIRFLSLAVGAWLVTKALLHGALTKWQGAVTVTAFALAWFFERFVRETVIPQFYFVDYVHAEKN